MAEDRELAKQPLTVAELDRLISKRNHLDFLNTRNDIYRDMGLKDSPPTRERAVRLMAEHVNLLRRPILKVGDGPNATLVFGFDEKVWKETLS